MISIIVQARLGSTRLPKKILKKLDHRSSLELLIERLQKVKQCKQIIFAIPSSTSDDKLATILEKKKFIFYRGPEFDVASRFIDAAKKYGADHIIRITADCPLIDPDLIDQMIRIYFSKNLEYFSNVVPPTYADGFDIEIFKTELLIRNYKHFSENDREHVTTYLRAMTTISKDNFRNKHNHSKIRLTLDNIDDLNLLRKIVQSNPTIADLSYNQIINLYNQMPEDAKTNLKYTRNYGMK